VVWGGICCGNRTVGAVVRRIAECADRGVLAFARVTSVDAVELVSEGPAVDKPGSFPPSGDIGGVAIRERILRA
jgi:hypothetical protein